MVHRWAQSPRLGADARGWCNLKQTLRLGLVHEGMAWCVYGIDMCWWARAWRGDRGRGGHGVLAILKCCFAVAVLQGRWGHAFCI